VLVGVAASVGAGVEVVLAVGVLATAVFAAVAVSACNAAPAVGRSVALKVGWRINGAVGSTTAVEPVVVSVGDDPAVADVVPATAVVAEIVLVMPAVAGVVAPAVAVAVLVMSVAPVSAAAAGSGMPSIPDGARSNSSSAPASLRLISVNSTVRPVVAVITVGSSSLVALIVIRSTWIVSVRIGPATGTLATGAVVSALATVAAALGADPAVAWLVATSSGTEVAWLNELVSQPARMIAVADSSSANRRL
jgi:hypothetical protein